MRRANAAGAFSLSSASRSRRGLHHMHGHMVQLLIYLVGWSRSSGSQSNPNTARNARDYHSFATVLTERGEGVG